MLHPVYEFRLHPSIFEDWPYRGQPIRRFAGGQWIDDDGEHDLAFIVSNVCWMVELPYHRNIAWSWLTTHWTGVQRKHPRGNPWHYCLREGETDWGDPWERHAHPNEKAARSGMEKACGEFRCSNGRHVKFHLDDIHIKAGLLRERETKKIVTIPEKPLCMYCGHDWLRKDDAA